MSETTYKLGSLFDGIGGFPKVAEMYGIEPVWASEIEPACIRITQKHFPNMKHLGDITKINGAEIEPVDIITGGSPCFPASTMILTQAGYKPIETIKVGDFVLTHKGRWRMVTATGNKVAPTYYLKGNITIETTAEHPIYSADIKRTYNKKADGSRGGVKHVVNTGQWTEAQYMAGKQWATPLHVETLPIPQSLSANQHDQKPIPEFDTDFWYFVGRWIGDGWVRNGIRKDRPNGHGWGTIIICDSHDKEQELTNLVSKLSKNYSVEHCRTGVKVQFTSQVLCNWLVTNFGKGAAYKTIPSWVYNIPHHHKVALFMGIIDSDGYKISDTKYKITSISKSLILGIRLLAESLNYTTSIFYCKRPHKYVIENRVVNQHDAYTITICDNKHRRTGVVCGAHKWYKCRDFVPTHETKLVYNISVDEDESYIADSIVVHNCQDLSVAGKQRGINLNCNNCGAIINVDAELDSCPECGEDLSLTRSGLFVEQIRIIKEMREFTNGVYPKFIIWENVTGVTSSNNGDDFELVLKEFCGLLEEKLPPLRPEAWSNAGEILGESGSIAWRVLDAQYWGVPQRRRRIFLVVDFGGQRAGEILFKQESMRRYPTPSTAPWKRTPTKAQNSTGAADSNDRAYGIDGYNQTIIKDKSSTLGTNCGTSTGRNGVLCVATQQVNAEIMVDKCPTLTEANGTSGSNKPYVVLPEEPIVFEPGAASRLGGHVWNDVSGTLRADMGDNQPAVVVSDPVYCLQGNGIDRADTAGCNGKGWTENVCYTLNTIDRPAVAYGVSEHIDITQNEPDVYAFCHQQGFGDVNFTKDCSPTLIKNQTMAVLIEPNKNTDNTSVTAETKEVTLIENHPADSRVTISDDNVVQTLSARMGTGGGNVPMVIEETKNTTPCCESGFATYSEGVIGTLRASGGHYGGGSETLLITEPVTMTTGNYMQICDNQASTLLARDYKDPQIVIKPKSIVRRLTPLECERLQGFPDNWTASEADSERYKALGNSVALPCVDYVIKGIAEVLFDNKNSVE